MSRESVKQFGIDANVRCVSVYPTIRSRKLLTELKTVGLRLTRKQALHLAQVLLVAAKEWEDIEITAYRSTRQSDMTHQITVTSSR